MRPVTRRWAAVFWGSYVVAVFAVGMLAVSCAGAAPVFMLAVPKRAAVADPVRTGDRATYTDAAGQKYCGTVAAIDSGAGGVARAWVLLDGRPPHVAQAAPVAELVAGCAR